MQTHPLDRRTVKSPRRRLAPWLFAAVLAGCGGGEVLLVPFFTFGFSASTVGGVDHEVFLNLNPNAPATASGNFEAFSSLRIDNDSREVTGTYSGCTMTLDVGPFVGGVASTLMATKYSGRFTGANTIELTPSVGTLPVLTLVRGAGGTDTRPETC